MTKLGGGGRRGAALLAAAALVLLLAAVAAADVTCADVGSSLRPCLGYLTGKDAAPAAECCAGVQRLKTLAAGTAERRQACQCMKQAVAQYQGQIVADAARSLPDKCGAPVPFPIDPNVDCNNIP